MRASTAAAALLAILPGAGCEAAYGPTSPSANWVSFDSSRFTLYARPDSFCASQFASLAGVLEHQYTHATTVLGIAVGGRISMFLYNDGNEVDPPLGGPRAGVAFPETNAAHVTCTPPNDGGLWSLLSHEANHVIMQNGMGRAGTSFMNEGLASALVSDQHAPIGPTFLRMWVGGNRSRLRRIVDLVDDGKWNSSTENYNSSAAFLSFLLDRYGAGPVKQIYHATSSDIAGRIQSVFGKSIDTLEAEWLASF
jgi:hypothetical protein